MDFRILNLIEEMFEIIFLFIVKLFWIVWSDDVDKRYVLKYLNNISNNSCEIWLCHKVELLSFMMKFAVERFITLPFNALLHV